MLHPAQLFHKHSPASINRQNGRNWSSKGEERKRRDHLSQIIPLAAFPVDVILTGTNRTLPSAKDSWPRCARHSARIVSARVYSVYLKFTDDRRCFHSDVPVFNGVPARGPETSAAERKSIHAPAPQPHVNKCIRDFYHRVREIMRSEKWEAY